MLHIHRFACVGTAALLLLFTGAAVAGNVSIPNTFTAHTPAVATQVNANFGAVATAVNGSATDITALQGAVANLQSQLTTQQSQLATQQGQLVAQQSQLTTQQNTIDTLNTTVTSLNTTVAGQQTTIDTLNNTVTSLNTAVTNQQTTITNLQGRLTTVESNTVLQLDGSLGLVLDPFTNQPTARFTAVNVQVVNGAGGMGTINGVGNLIVGYNETDPGATEFCSDGNHSDASSCATSGGTWAANQRSGSHNLVVGNVNAYSRYGGFLAGRFNIVNGVYASVSGGANNSAKSALSSVSGGRANTAGGLFASVSGGVQHTTYSNYNWAAGSLFESQ
ncbi:MAG TPA: hypothetical protein VFN25_03535 [Dokdonella sp.]|uniref:hypothetical protein n=1 Tax=Dokdonella sp. TaxID=2291710 RepID=UPI002D8069A1|nr:hypothetical protein [Dokdonella sp.]HET9031959.1 hypothetical protein [Dokdonella sp.]